MSARLPGKYLYIVVEGPVGAGKTSLARVMGERTGGMALLEDPDANPFLPGFYQDRARYALPAQLYFLFQRSAQVRKLSQPDLFAGLTVADFMIDKDALFARLTLSDDEFALYRQVWTQLKPQAPVPDLVICRPRPRRWSSACAAAASPMSATFRTSIWSSSRKPTRGSSISTTPRRC
jgi:deoxyadenosine/deoxycytidine kinase